MLGTPNQDSRYRDVTTLIEVASASINSFRIAGLEATEAVSPAIEEPVFVLTAGQLREIIAETCQDLKDEVQDLRQEVQYLKDTKPGITSLRVDDAFEAIGQIDEHLARIDRTRTTAPPHGSKTIARITKIDEILKARGSTTLKELERILKIRPQEMSRILTRLDKRRYEIFLRDGSKQEKVMRMKKTC